LKFGRLRWSPRRAAATVLSRRFDASDIGEALADAAAGAVENA